MVEIQLNVILIFILRMHNYFMRRFQRAESNANRLKVDFHIWDVKWCLGVTGRQG
ncbi:hypothetical protein GCM10027180_14330 [Microbulbifer echini]